MKNEYEIRGEVTAIIINSPKYGRHEALISTTNIERLKLFPNSWCVKWSDTSKSFYVIGNVSKEYGKTKKILLHRWLTNAPDGMDVDHVDNNSLNNVNSNLRVISRAENQQNPRGARSHNPSGIRGVTWKKSHKKWCVQIRINNVSKHIGLFDNIEKAEFAAIEARKKYMPFSKEASA